MSVLATILTVVTAMQVQDAPAVSLCDVQNERIPVGSEVVIEGRFHSDFYHFETLVGEGCRALVSLHLRDGESELSDRFLDATWRRRPFPDTDQIEVLIRMRGVVQEHSGYQGMRLGSVVWVREFLDVSVSESGTQ